jgi:toxin YoeB
MFDESGRNPFVGIGKPEPLKGNLRGKWSRRIDDEHRLVYDVTETEITLYSLWGHYD